MLSRDRCYCEDGFDELRTQWGWGGFDTQEIALQPDHRACGGAVLQLVELVSARGETVVRGHD